MIAKLSKQDVQFTKLVVFVNASVPLVMLAFDLSTGRAGANPLEYITHATGVLALVFLCLSLAVTPLRRVSNWQWLAVHRRTLGLFAFFYAVLHLLAYWWFDKAFNIPAVIEDVAKRPFILVGMATFVLLIPLAVTSTNGMIKRLGGKRWRVLHRLAYVTALGGALHYFMLVKADTRIPVAFFCAIAALLAYRIYDNYIRPRLGAGSASDAQG